MDFEVSLKVRLGWKASGPVKMHLYRHTQNSTLKDTVHVHLTVLHPERKEAILKAFSVTGCLQIN